MHAHMPGTHAGCISYDMAPYAVHATSVLKPFVKVTCVISELVLFQGMVAHVLVTDPLQLY